MKVAIIGLGLIGGSAAKDIRKAWDARIYGMDSNPNHIERALEIGLIDRSVDLEGLAEMDLVVLAIPVNAIRMILPQVMQAVSEQTVVLDMGSTKSGIVSVANKQTNRAQFVAAHPIAGTEFSGPDAAHEGLFKDKVNIICEKDHSSDEALTMALRFFNALGMNTVFMNAEEHDKHIAYVSHISHISSFMLGKTVLEIEKNEKNIFNLAGSGFESTVRLAKSSPEMWSPIFVQNQENILLALDEYIKNLQGFRELIAASKEEELMQDMRATNHIKTVLSGLNKK
jgi:prephenate dehydrogenase